jgi:hypothetical protein
MYGWPRVPVAERDACMTLTQWAQLHDTISSQAIPSLLIELEPHRLKYIQQLEYHIGVSSLPSSPLSSKLLSSSALAGHATSTIVRRWSKLGLPISAAYDRLTWAYPIGEGRSITIAQRCATAMGWSIQHFQQKARQCASPLLSILDHVVTHSTFLYGGLINIQHHSTDQRQVVGTLIWTPRVSWSSSIFDDAGTVVSMSIPRPRISVLSNFTHDDTASIHARMSISGCSVRGIDGGMISMDMVTATWQLPGAQFYSSLYHLPTNRTLPLPQMSSGNNDTKNDIEKKHDTWHNCDGKTTPWLLQYQYNNDATHLTFVGNTSPCYWTYNSTNTHPTIPSSEHSDNVSSKKIISTEGAANGMITMKPLTCATFNEYKCEAHDSAITYMMGHIDDISNRYILRYLHNRNQCTLYNHNGIYVRHWSHVRSMNVMSHGMKRELFVIVTSSPSLPAHINNTPDDDDDPNWEWDYEGTPDNKRNIQAWSIGRAVESSDSLPLHEWRIIISTRYAHQGLISGRWLNQSMIAIVMHRQVSIYYMMMSSPSERELTVSTMKTTPTLLVQFALDSQPTLIDVLPLPSDYMTILTEWITISLPSSILPPLRQLILLYAITTPF